jgi:hypothetical protein
MVTLQRNVGGGTAGVRGEGVLRDPWTGQDFKETYGTRNDRGGIPSRPSASVTHSTLERA